MSAAKKLSFNLDNVINKVRSAYAKNPELAKKISRGDKIPKPTRDDQFICWKNSFWENLTGIRGIPYGKVVQIAGKSNSGKSTTALEFMKQAQDQGVAVILWDSENKFSATRFDKYFKGSSQDLLIVPSRLILEGASIVENYIHALKEEDPEVKILVVYDSVGGGLPKNEDEGSLLDSKQMAAHSKENGQMLRAFVRLMEKYHDKKGDDTIAILLINQVYASIGPMAKGGVINSGGARTEYYSSLILQLARKSDLTKVKDKIKRKIGIVTRAKVTKNHLFDGEDSVAELELTVTARGIGLLDKSKTKKDEGNGWGGDNDDEVII